MDDIYRQLILDHYKNPKNFGKMKNPSYSCHLYNSACGDDITIDIKITNNKQQITDIKFRGNGCAISMASASLLTEKVLGKTTIDVQKLKTEDILDMLGITLTPTRLKCALLPLEVVQKAIGSNTG